MTQVTLIALYGRKHPQLSDLIEFCQDYVASQLAGAFHPYDLRQVHATVIGLERRLDSDMENLNLWKKRKLPGQKMNFGGLIDHLRSEFSEGINVQIGGFEERPYPFTSRRSIPFVRSFSIQGDKVVVMGWPIRRAGDEAEYPDTLDSIRRSAQSYHILHAYHDPDDSKKEDRDLYFRIGLADTSKFTFSVGAGIERGLRKELSRRDPIDISIEPRNLYIAAYEDETLPLETTECWSLDDPRVTGEFVEGLYRS